MASFSEVRELNLANRDQGFAVLGVNLDSLGQDALGKRPTPRKSCPPYAGSCWSAWPLGPT